MFNKFLGKFSKDIGIDLGTSNTLVYVKDKGIVINEPSIVAINTKNDQIIAIGEKAKKMIGRTPPHIVVTKPLDHGVISDFEVTEKLLKYFIDKIHQDGFTLLPRPKVVIGIPMDLTEVEKKAVEDAAMSAGAREIHLVEEPIAGAIGARLPILDAVANMIVDIGGGITEIAIISLGGIVRSKSIKIAGEELNKNVIQYARERFNLLLGEHIAEIAKIKVGSACELEEQLQIEIRGRDLISGLPKEVIVNDTQIRDAISRSVRIIVENIKSTLEVAPPELVADIYHKGMILTGGGSMLKGLDKVIARMTEIPVYIADDPLTCVVRGTGILLDDPELMKEVCVPSTRRSN